MAKRKTVSTRKTARPKAKARAATGAAKSRATKQAAGRRGVRKPVRKATATRPATKAGRSGAAKRAQKQRAARRVVRKQAQTRATTQKALGRRPTARQPARPAPASPDPSRLPLVIVDEPEDGLLEITATSTLDLEHRPRLPIALAELEEEWTGAARGDASLKAGDNDADSQRAYFTGDETPGGDNPTPDQDIVDYIGRSLGVEYDDDEELQGAEKIAERDRHRWELNPASAERPRPRRR